MKTQHPIRTVVFTFVTCAVAAAPNAIQAQVPRPELPPVPIEQMLQDAGVTPGTPLEAQINAVEMESNQAGPTAPATQPLAEVDPTMIEAMESKALLRYAPIQRNQASAHAKWLQQSDAVLETFQPAAAKRPETRIPSPSDRQPGPVLEPVRPRSAAPADLTAPAVPTARRSARKPSGVQPLGIPNTVASSAPQQPYVQPAPPQLYVQPPAPQVMVRAVCSKCGRVVWIPESQPQR